jgi:hypothetical protein
VARQAVHDILHMPPDPLKALRGTWFASQSRAHRSSWCGSLGQARHRQFQLCQQLCKANWHSLRVKTLGSIRGRPLALKLPIPKATVRWLLTWRPTALVAHRARR